MKTVHIFAVLAVTLALAGCSGAKESLGLAKKAPDEFAVVKRAPLAMPPNYQLRPPQPGAPRPQEMATSDAARQTVVGESAPAEGNFPSDAEGTLLKEAGAAQADPAIRQKVDAETEVLKDRNKPVTKKLFGLLGGDDEPSASVVDAPEEAERLRDNVEEGKPVTEGETPSIEE